MSFVLDPNIPDIELLNDNILGEGENVFEVNMPGGAAWTSGLTVAVDIRSPYPGDEDQWETLHTFTNKGSFKVNMIHGRIYRVVASAKGPWCYLNLVRVRATK